MDQGTRDHSGRIAGWREHLENLRLCILEVELIAFYSWEILTQRSTKVKELLRKSVINEEDFRNYLQRKYGSLDFLKDLEKNPPNEVESLPWTAEQFYKEHF